MEEVHEKPLPPPLAEPERQPIAFWRYLLSLPFWLVGLPLFFAAFSNSSGVIGITALVFIGLAITLVFSRSEIAVKISVGISIFIGIAVSLLLVALSNICLICK
ncbi:hypothetical protein [Pelomonas sp. Root1217]|uniref:hypothetical protein n=1 Tax=Pelomonas sp. Root1217 TaxID=1736430 RepID=UPI0012F844B7|nr:hypothetical protein [Pelomonas sp. Root1217]